MKIERSFSLPAEEVRERLLLLTDHWGKHGVTASWEGACATLSGKVRGITFDGTLQVEATKLLGDIKASGLLAETLGRPYVESKLSEYLNPATSVEQLRSKRA